VKNLLLITFGLGQSRYGAGNGLCQIGEKLKSPHWSVIFQQYDDSAEELISQFNPNKLVLVGHSFGGDKSVKLASNLRRNVDYMMLLDPVPQNGLGWFNFSDFRVSGNVLLTDCYYRNAFWPPWSCKVRYCENACNNYKRSWGHNEFCQNAEIEQKLTTKISGLT